MLRRPGTFGIVSGFLLVVALVPDLVADTVVKKDGRRIDGQIIAETDDQVTVQTKFGPVDIKRSEIVKIEKGKTPAQEFKDLWEAVDRNDSRALIELAEWCDENRLNRESRKVYREVLNVDEDNEAAREELGYVRVDDKWVTKRDLAETDRKQKEEERKRQAKERAAASGSGAKKKTSRSDANDPMAGIGDVSGDVAPFLEPIKTNQAADETVAQELEDFFGARFSVATSEHFSLRCQLPMAEVLKHIELAERLYVQCNKLFALDPAFRHWQGTFLMFHVKQKGTYVDLIDWMDKNKVTDWDAEDKRFFKDGGGMIVPNKPLAAREEGETPYERAVAHWVGQAYIVWRSAGVAPPWLSEGFAAYTSVTEFGANSVYCSTNTKYANDIEVADKNSDGAYQLVCFDIIDGALDDAHPFAELVSKSLNQLDFADLAKSWSLVDFLMREHNEKFRTFIADLRKYQGSSEETLRQVFGWTGEDIDKHWKEYVLANYSRTPEAN